MECQEDMKRAVTSKVDHVGDGLYKNRLLSYLKKQFPFMIKKLTPVRKNVFIVDSVKGVFILKGFSSYHRLKLQEAFTSSLIKEGFTKTYSFLNYAIEPPLIFENIYFGCIEYIEHAEENFTYTEHIDRIDGLALLSEYHLVSEKLVQRYMTLIPQFKQLEKWQVRTDQFISHLSLIKYFIEKEILHEFLQWADWALKGMKNEKLFLQQGKRVILHGDVAHHNFLRGKNGVLYLLDFDLISIGNQQVDYLQYANRILPAINWSFAELEKMPNIKPLLSEKGFLYALAYPTDIFREWNRAVRQKIYVNPMLMRKLLNMTIDQYQSRKRFIEKIKKEIEE
ncbi:phosphotransferase [Cytobacillus horneckiae]|uniref:phosphotransferase n=1 Tax=Cytobacillus horneckiae TaxID=549687 RepID=UPI003D9A2F76